MEIIDTPITEAASIKNDNGLWMAPAFEMQKLEMRLNEAYNKIDELLLVIKQLNKDLDKIEDDFSTITNE